MKRDIRFNRDRMLLGADFYGRYQITPQTGQIRIEMSLVEGQGTYEFDIKKKIKSGTEKIIRDNDLFISRAIGIALMVESNTARGTAPLLSYPMINGAHLPAGIKGFINSNPYVLYNGVVTMKTDQSVNMTGLPMTHFLHVPETQPVGMINSADDTLMSSGIQPQFNIDNILYELPEVLVIAGNHSTDFKVEAPVVSGLQMATPEGYTAKIVLIIEGWLFAAGANEKYKMGGNPWKESI